MNFFKLKIFVLLFSVLCFLFSIPLSAAATQFLVSWRAQSYVPGWYAGKIMPTKGSPVNIGFELINNGRIMDLSNTKVRWYINDKLVRNENNGLGIKSISFTVPDYGGQDMVVRISLPDYSSSPLDYILTIPVKFPEAVISRNFPIAALQQGANSFEAIPFFFNVKDLNSLSFDWMSNGRAASVGADMPWLFSFGIDPKMPAGSPVSVELVVQNVLNQLETANRRIQLRVSNQ